MNKKSLLFKAMIKGLSASLATIVIYQFFYIEFIRSTVEDAAFDAINWFALSKTKVENKAANTFILMVDDKYLTSKQLLDENNETTYGYIFPRGYIAEIIQSIDILVEDIEAENYPKALFIDYDFSYLSDPLNQTKSVGDIALLEVLKKDRPYTIYLPMTDNHNFIYHSKDTKIQTLIQENKMQFVSVGLTTASDSISRRYYPFETYNDSTNQKVPFTNIAIKLWNENLKNTEVKSLFSQEGISLIENRIIFKDYQITENQEYISWQSNWKNLSAMSANYPLDMIYEEDLKDSIIMLGATHSLSSDNFEIDAFSAEISGIEMHANTLMTMQYLNGKLQRLDVKYSLIIIFVFITFLDFILGIIYNPLKKIAETREYNFFPNILNIFPYILKMLLRKLLSDEQDTFQDKWLLFLSMFILLVVSYNLLVDYRIWFNWMIPSLMSIPLMLIIFIARKFKR